MATALALFRLINDRFEFMGHEVRTALHADGNVWFCAKDVCEALEIAWGGAASTLRTYPEEWRTVIYLMTIQGSRDAVFISEPAIYRLIFRSNKPKAVAFAKWVCEEVLPAIRKHGFYGKVDVAAQAKIINAICRLVPVMEATKDPAQKDAMKAMVDGMLGSCGYPPKRSGVLGRDESQTNLNLTN